MLPGMISGWLCDSLGGYHYFFMWTLLERYLGLDYFAAGVYDIDRNPTVTLPAMAFAENPAFRYRQSQGLSLIHI